MARSGTSPDARLGVVRYAQIPATRWRNGAGTTRVVAQRLLGGTGPDAVWRVSIAEIAQAAQFSRYPGAERVTTVLRGGPVELDVDGSPHTLHSGDVLSYSGEVPTSASKPSSPALVLNVMTHRTRMSAQVRLVDLREVTALGVASTTVAVVLDGEVRVHTAGGQQATLHPCDALVPRPELRLVEGEGTVVQVRMQNFRARHAFA